MLEQEPRDIAARAASVGEERLDRTNLDILVTSVIGGGEVSLGGLAAMTVLGAVLSGQQAPDLYTGLASAGLAFPIGFVFVIVGRSELFTENFLIPVAAVFKRERTVRSLVELWAISWFGNLVGCAGTAAMVLVPHAVGDPIHAAYAAYTDYKLSVPPVGSFVSAMLAGGVMTALTWLLLSVRHSVARMLAIYAAGYLLFAANLSHSIVSASVLIVGLGSTSHELRELLAWLAIATTGNLVGGVGLVTLFRLTQAHQQDQT